MECKKAQPKEVMLPANLAKGRAAAAARGLGEFALMVSSGGTMAGQCPPPSVLSLPSMRYSPYTLPPSSLSPSSSSPSNTSSFHQALLQLQLVGGTTTTTPMFSCKTGQPQQPSGNYYNMTELLSLPGFQGLESPSPYQVPVGL